MSKRFATDALAPSPKVFRRHLPHQSTSPTDLDISTVCPPGSSSTTHTIVPAAVEPETVVDLTQESAAFQRSTCMTVSVPMDSTEDNIALDNGGRTSFSHAAEEEANGEATELEEHWFFNAGTKVVGVQHYNGVVCDGEGVMLQRQQNNPYDRNAIQVLNVRNQQIGHLPREMAALLAPVMDRFLQNGELGDELRWKVSSLEDRRTPFRFL